MMRSEDDLLDLVGALHLAAVDPDPEAWRSVLSRVGDAFDRSAVAVLDYRVPDSVVEYTQVRMPPGVAEFAMKIASANAHPMLRDTASYPIGVPRVLTGDPAGRAYRSFRESEIFELLMTADMVHIIEAMLDVDGESSLSFASMRGSTAGPYRPDELEFGQRVLRHVAAACLVRRRMGAALAAAEAPRAALALLDKGVLLVDRAARVAYANASAERLLARGDGLALARDGTLVGARPDATARLRRAIAAAAAVAAGRALESSGAEAVLLPRPHGGRAYAAQVLPLAPAAEFPGLARLVPRPEAALLVADPDAAQCRTPPEDRLREAYGLSRAEAALAARLAQGIGLVEAAEDLGVARNTAKAQAKAVYAKLDVDRQAALVRRVMGDLGGVALPVSLPQRDRSHREASR